MICPNCKVDIKLNYKNYGRDLGLAKYNELVAEIKDIGSRVEVFEDKDDKEGDLSELDYDRLYNLKKRYRELEEEIMKFVFI